MSRRVTTCSILLVALVIAGGVVIVGLTRTSEAPRAPEASFAVLDRAPTTPVPPSASAVTTDPTRMRLLGTDPSGRNYLLRQDGSQLCLAMVWETDPTPEVIETCGAREMMTARLRWDTFKAGDVMYVALLIPDEYHDAKVVSSGTRGQVLQEPNLRVFELSAGKPAHLTLDSPRYRDLEVEVPRF